MPFLKASGMAAVFSAGMLASLLAQAHPKLVSSTPAEGAEVAAPDKIELQFSEKLVTQFSGAKLVMTAMPGMEHPPMPVKAAVSGAGDPKTMIITPAAPLTPGSYKVEWRAVSSDTHPITGQVSFKVK